MRRLAPRPLRRALDDALVRTVTVACRSAVWAQELELLAGDLKGRLNARIGTAQSGPGVTALRFVVRDL